MVSYRNRLLSYILENFMLSSDIDEDQQDTNYTDDKLNQYKNLKMCQYMQTGSSAEKLYIPFPSHTKSDIDLMFEFPYMYAVDPEQLTMLEKQQYNNEEENNSFLYIEYSNEKYPCYLKLYFNLTQSFTTTTEKVTDASFLLPDTNIYLTPGEAINPTKVYFPAAGMALWLKKKWPLDEAYEEKLEIHGPSLCTTSKNPNTPLPTDHVPVLKCLHWPKSAMNWISRTRTGNWPDQNLINAMVKFGCHIVPVSHILSSKEVKPIEWRFSFSICELLIAKTLTFYQRKCYLIIKALVDVHIKQDSELSTMICSYYLKTILFWLCESMGKYEWTYETLYDRFNDFIDTLINCFENKHIKHYFIPEMNIIDHLTNDVSKKIAEKFVLIKNDLLNMIRICEEHYWNTNQFIRFDPIIEVLTNKNENQSDDYSCVIWCCASIMQAFIKQHKLIDRSLKMANDCLKRNYLESCSEESAVFLLHITHIISEILNDENVYSKENLLAHSIMMRICEIKTLNDQPYETMKANYNAILNHLEMETSTQAKRSPVEYFLSYADKLRSKIRYKYQTNSSVSQK